ncbi:CHASE domain-containing protein [Iodobacter ciconiae]|uniref:PAS domain S-box protein n=1 Tax=Iodobacter ciconiae TaxID=2496266 RepID=A0A3S8ZVV5_9NEIS|nr:CHASE domain-containing protein [Iodobacter ciconiae]AZN37555.1 PAS domain S-box protein [Iodobacter ciconiae]
MIVLSLLRRYPVALRTFLAGVVLTACVQVWLNFQHQNHAQTQLNHLALIYAERIESKLDAEINILRGIQNAFIANTNLNKKTFSTILKQQNIQGRFPDFISVQFIREIASSDIDVYIHHRKLDNPAFNISLSSPRAVYQIIDFIFPEHAVLHEPEGFEISHQTANLIAIEYARDQGRGVASPAYALQGYKNASLGFAIRFPIYSPNKPLNNQKERRSAFIGSLGATFTIDKMIAWLGNDVEKNIRLQLQDTGTTSGLNKTEKSKIIYKTKSLSNRNNELNANALIQFPGRQWKLSLFAPASIFPRYNALDYFIWILGFTLSIFIAVLLQRQRNNRASALDLAEQITQDLRKNKQHYQQVAQLTEDAHDLIISRDLNGKIIYANRAARIYFSESTPVLLGKNKPLLLSAELAINEIPIRQECQHRHTDGELHFLELTLFPLYNQEAVHSGSAMFVHNITQHKELMIELQKSRERFSALLELAADWYWEQDKNFRFTQVSTGFFNLYSLNQTSVIGHQRWELSDGCLSAEEWRAHQSLLKTLRSFRDFIYTLKVGASNMIVRVSGQPFFDEQGELQGYRGIGYDITASKNNEQAIQLEQQRIASILNSMADGVITTALNGDVEFINPSAIQLLNCRTATSIGKHINHIYQVISPKDQNPLIPLFSMALDSIEKNTPSRTVLLNTHKQSLLIQESIIHLKNSTGTLIGFALIIRQI